MITVDKRDEYSQLVRVTADTEESIGWRTSLWLKVSVIKTIDEHED